MVRLYTDICDSPEFDARRENECRQGLTLPPTVVAARHMSKQETKTKRYRPNSCSVTKCETEPPEGYEYCDDHHLLRDRSDDNPGDQPPVNPEQHGGHKLQ